MLLGRTATEPPVVTRKRSLSGGLEFPSISPPAGRTSSYRQAPPQVPSRSEEKFALLEATSVVPLKIEVAFNGQEHTYWFVVSETSQMSVSQLENHLRDDLRFVTSPCDHPISLTPPQRIKVEKAVNTLSRRLEQAESLTELLSSLHLHSQGELISPQELLCWRWKTPVFAFKVKSKPSSSPLSQFARIGSRKSTIDRLKAPRPTHRRQLSREGRVEF